MTLGLYGYLHYRMTIFVTVRKICDVDPGSSPVKLAD